MSLETKKFDIQEHLRTPQEQAAYIDAALEDGDASVIASALGDIARARGVGKFAEEIGVTRAAIYKTFVPGGNPTLDTLTKATKALGLRLTVKPAA